MNRADTAAYFAMGFCVFGAVYFYFMGDVLNVVFLLFFAILLKPKERRLL